MKRNGEPTRHFFTYYNRTIPENWNAPALTDYNGTTSYTYGEMAAQMFKLQILLEQAGVGKGDKVVIAETRPTSRTKRWRLVEISSRASGSEVAK